MYIEEILPLAKMTGKRFASHPEAFLFLDAWKKIYHFGTVFEGVCVFRDDRGYIAEFNPDEMISEKWCFEPELITEEPVKKELNRDLEPYPFIECPFIQVTLSPGEKLVRDLI